MQNALKDRKISMGHAKILAGVEQIEIQTMLLGRILKDDLSVRAAEGIIRNQAKQKKGSPKSKEHTNPILDNITKKLCEHLGAKVSIERSSKGKGHIKIAFTSDNDFNDIVDSLLET